MDDYSTTTNPSGQLNSLLGGNSGEPLIPESLTTFFIISFVLINILTIIFLIFWVMGMVRRWKVQTAILHMQKDVAEIKESLAKPSVPVKPAPSETPIFIEPQKKSEQDVAEQADTPRTQNS